MPQKIKLSLDQLDTAMLFNISVNWGSNGFLASIFEKGKSTITDRIERLEALSLICRVQSGVRNYQLTKAGKKILKKAVYQTNITLLQEMEDTSTELAEDTADYLYSSYIKFQN
jgi:Mn-dependent DtxR family transcriptional regulator